MRDASRGASEAAFEKVDTGVGAALIIGGQIYRGAVETAGEIGHSTIAEDGPVCRCGNRGSLERRNRATMAGNVAPLEVRMSR